MTQSILTPVKYQYNARELATEGSALYIEFFGSGWGIVRERNGSVLNRNFEWEYQPQPSSRTEDFYRRCRYESVDEAVQHIERYLNAGSKPDASN